MTVFITHCCKKAWLSALVALWLALLTCTAAAPRPAHAQALRGGGAIQIMEVSLNTREAAVLLNASLEIGLPQVVAEALHKGVPIFFVAQARIVRPRWYWADTVVADVQRYYRLSYQPLTNRWRLSISAERLQPGGGLAFGQNFETLADAMTVLRRIIDWRLAPSASFSSGAVYTVEFGLQLDVSQLPRPLQIGMLGQNDWKLGAQVDFRWTPQPVSASAATASSAPSATPLPAAHGEDEAARTTSE